MSDKAAPTFCRSLGALNMYIYLEININRFHEINIEIIWNSFVLNLFKNGSDIIDMCAWDVFLCLYRMRVERSAWI